MRILHLSHESLPDWRVEKSALTAIKSDHYVMFAGKAPAKYQSEVFSKIFALNWSAGARYGLPYHWYTMKKHIRKILLEAKPDIVHAHNLFSARMMSEFEIPFVYDDHEHWARHPMLLAEMSSKFNFRNSLSLDSLSTLRRRLTNHYLVRLWTKWEKEIVSSTPTITVSSRASEDLGIFCQSCCRQYVVPNYPTLRECERLESSVNDHETFSSVYAGSDGNNAAKYPHRNLDGFEEAYEKSDVGKLTIVGWTGNERSKVSYTGFLPRRKMFEEMRAHCIGLLPWKKHWAHCFVSPNKAYEYAHSGLVIGCVSSLTNVIESLGGNCVVFDDYGELVSQVKHLRASMDETNRKRKKTLEFARKNHLWERAEGRILEAYQRC